MNTIHWTTIFLTFITVITSYFAMMKIFDFDFTKNSWYSKTRNILWVVTAVAWIVNAFVLKNHFTSDITIGAQLLIQIVMNAVFIALPLMIFALYVNFRLFLVSRKEKYTE